jgi:hypothetical protein
MTKPIVTETELLVSELGGDEDDLVDGEQIWVQANQRVRARLRKPT